MKSVAIIPARGGSKRIPNKNIRNFLGKPIIAYSIDAALKSRLFDEVMVSTDAKDIKSIAIKYGAKIPFLRSKETADDFATLKDVLLEVLNMYKSKGMYFDICCCILPTAPLIQQKYLRKGFDLLMDKKFDSIRPVVRFSYPIHRAWYLDNEGRLSFIYKKYLKTRSQDLKPAYHDAGQFYWFYVKKELNYDNCGGFEIKEYETQDIDDEDDWKLLLLKYKNLFGNKS
jgi:pseudaminic acid cytidylyltransferase